MKNEMLFSLGKYFFAIPILIFGIFHFTNAGGMAGAVPSFIPGSLFWVYLTGVALIAAAVSLIINKYVKLSMQLLALMLVIFLLTIHLPAALDNMMAGAPMLLKDLGLAGAALVFASLEKEEES